MSRNKIWAMYFSPTGTTRKVVETVAQLLAGSGTFGVVDFTLPDARKQVTSFAKDDVVVVGVPVYAGRVPNILLPYLRTVAGNGARAVPVVMFGNRAYEDALVELADIMEAQGLRVEAAGAFVGEHSFSTVLAQGRPDENDMALVRHFARRIGDKLAQPDRASPLEIRGNRPYRPYYMPKDPNSKPVDIRKVKPKTSADCTQCKHCVEVCPMGSIDPDDVTLVSGICIKCGACIKGCPVGAKYYDDEGYLRHKREVEVNFVSRKEPEVFV